MNALVIAAGSIGLRHLRNLRTLGVDELLVFEPDEARRATATAETGAEPFSDLDAALKRSPDVAVVASPSHLHMEHALSAVGAGCHLFIEKPLSHSATGLRALSERVKSANLTTIVGCNMRFHPGPAKVKDLLDDGAIGRVLFQRVHTGSYLPGWRPHQDYRQSYSALPEMGGGVIFDCIHEIDLTRWYGGEVNEVFCEMCTTGALDIGTEDYAFLLCWHAAGFLSEVHLDYVSRTYERGCHIAGSEGSVFWDYRTGTVKLFRADGETWDEFPQPAEWEPNDMYVDEMRHFLACIENGESTTLPVADGANVMRFAFAAKSSAEQGAWVAVSPEHKDAMPPLPG